MEQSTTIEIEEHADSDRSHPYTVYGPADSPIDAANVDVVRLGELGSASVTFEAGSTRIDFEPRTQYSITLTTKLGIGDEVYTAATITVGEDT